MDLKYPDNTVCHAMAVSLLSSEGFVYPWLNDLLQGSGFLEMLVRRNIANDPIVTNLSRKDLKLCETILTLGVYPCPYEYKLKPEGFATATELGDYMDLLWVDKESIDWNNEYLNDFLVSLGYGSVDEETDEEFVDISIQTFVDSDSEPSPLDIADQEACLELMAREEQV